MTADPRWLPTVACLVLVELSAGIFAVNMFPALTAVIAEYGSPVTAGWLVTAYLLTASVSAAIGGRLGDLYGRKRILIVMLLLILAGCALSAWAQALPLMIAGRALQGLAGSVTPLGLGIIREHFDDDKVPIGVGMLVMGVTFGSGVGVLLSGLLVDNFPWRSIFVTGALLAAGCAALVAALCPPSRRSAQTITIDYLGGALFIAGIAMVLLALTVGQAQGWLSRGPILLVLGGAACLACWTWWELRLAAPMIDPRLLTSRQTTAPMLCTILLGMGGIQATALMFLLLQQPLWTGVGLGISATVAGVIKTPSSVFAAFTAPVFGRLCKRFGGVNVVLIGFGMSIAGWLILIAYSQSATLIGFLLAFCFMSGSAAVTVGVYDMVLSQVPPSRVGELTGVMAVFRSGGQAIGTQLVAMLLAVHTVTDPAIGPARFPAMSSYVITFLYICATCIAGAAIAWTVRKPARDARADKDMGEATC